MIEKHSPEWSMLRGEVFRKKESDGLSKIHKWIAEHYDDVPTELIILSAGIMEDCMAEPTDEELEELKEKYTGVKPSIT